MLKILYVNWCKFEKFEIKTICDICLVIWTRQLRVTRCQFQNLHYCSKWKLVCEMFICIFNNVISLSSEKTWFFLFNSLTKSFDLKKKCTTLKFSLRPFTLLQISGVKKKRPRITSVLKAYQKSPWGYGHLLKKETGTRSFSSDKGEFFLYMKLQFYETEYKLIIYRLKAV